MILMYHHVCPADEIPSAAATRATEGWQYNILPEDLAFQLAFLRRAGFRFVSLDDYVRSAVDADHGPQNLVAVTFDDGWLDNHTHAFPVLVAAGIPATFFVVSGPIDGADAARRMTTTMLRELVAAGMEIGGHTRTHPNLAALAERDLDPEIGGCRADLEGLLGQPVRFLAYPGGRFNDAVERCVARHGFRAACSVNPAGRNDRRARYRLSRDVFSARFDSWRDHLLLRPSGRLAWRAARAMRAALRQSR
jgi:peptidoglycan/xylan/chitin deacetylase (PgdA/CDA1 family)